MQKIYTLLFFLFFINSALGQGGTWTWISGDSIPNSPGVFGTQGVPSVYNHPPAVYEPCEWKDKQGNFWLYGGWDYDHIAYNDLWKYNPFTNEWTWVNGDSYGSTIVNYGTKGVPDAANTPGGRMHAYPSWVDTTGNLWLFGGSSLFLSKFLNDLWKYDINTNLWTWISGSSLGNDNGHHGTKGVPGIMNMPGSRDEANSAWSDSLNNLWLFGGEGMNENRNYAIMNDLWKFNIADNEWTWMKGSPYGFTSASYGIKGVADSMNDPGARWFYSRWKDSNNNFWLMGGYSGDNLNDVWKYEPSTNQWIWMNGSKFSTNSTGSYSQYCNLDSSNLPAARMEHRSSVVDNCMRFWMFGGANYGQEFSYLNDLWIFYPDKLEWNWISGSRTYNDAGNYGSKGVPSYSNLPPSRRGALAWWSNDNKFYMYGGVKDLNTQISLYSDMWVFSPDTNCIPVCNAIILPPPQATFYTDNTVFCVNDCINLVNNSNNASSYQWLFPGGIPPSSTDQNPQVCYLDSGKYNITLIASNSAGSDTLTLTNYITVNPAPPLPNITQHDTILYFNTDTSYKSYQWYFDSTLVHGATDTVLVISKSGNYNVEVTGTNGCKISVGINVVIGLQNYMNDNVVEIYPNPAQKQFTVYGLRFTVKHIDIYNILGEVVQQWKPETVNSKPETISVSSLPPGIYFVQLIGDNKRWIGRFVKE